MRKDFIEQCNRITMENITPDFSSWDLSKEDAQTRKQMKLIYAIYNLDMQALVTSYDFKEYKKQTPAKPEQQQWIGNNEFNAKHYVIPMGYEPNIAMQSAILPRLKEIYNSTAKMVKAKNGKFSFDKIFSLICDKVLFNSDSPFTAGMDIMRELSKSEDFEQDIDYMSNDVIPQAQIIASMLKAGKLISTGAKLLGDIKHLRVDYVGKDLLPVGTDLAKLLYSLPKSLITPDDFDSWFDSALAAVGVSVKDGYKKTYQTAEKVSKVAEKASIALEGVQEAKEVGKAKAAVHAVEKLAETKKEESAPFMNPPEIDRSELVPLLEDYYDITKATVALQNDGKTEGYKEFDLSYVPGIRRAFGYFDRDKAVKIYSKLLELYGTCSE